MLLDDVRTELARQAEGVPAGTLEPQQVLARTVRRVRRRRVGRLATVTAALVALLVGLVVVLNRSSNEKQIVVSGVTTTVPSRPIAAMPDAQLRAHLGDGVPAGWQPADFGDARVFVPGDWLVELPGTCVGGRVAPGIISLGQPLHGECDAVTRSPEPAQAVSLLPWTYPPSGALVGVVHGYRVYAGPSTREMGAPTAYEVPQLGVEIAMRGSLQRRILDTLAPSSRKVALAFAGAPVPRGHAVTTDGVTVTIPTAWTVTTPTSLRCEWLSPLAGSTPALRRIRPHVVLDYCPMIPAIAVRAPHDGLDLYVSPEGFAPPKTYQQPFVVLHRDATTISVSTEIGDASVLDLVVRRAGSSATHVLQLGLGRDGRVAGGILASLTATS